ncbi:MAG: hypothetical protein VB071_01780 [Lawsonibacter sp.]|nr:hypothetical protein [Lawsonibacter sp.]
MDNRLHAALWDGEEIRWSGRPKPFRLMDKTFQSSILITWVISALVVLAAAGLLIPSLAADSRSLSDIVILSVIILFLPVIILFLPVILSARPLMDKRCLEEKTIYAITNFRIIAIVKDEVMYLPIGKGMKVTVEYQEDGCGTLRFGELVGKPARKSRTHAVLGLHSDNSKADVLGLLFYHVDQPDQLTRYFA